MARNQLDEHHKGCVGYLNHEISQLIEQLVQSKAREDEAKAKETVAVNEKRKAQRELEAMSHENSRLKIQAKLLNPNNRNTGPKAACDMCFQLMQNEPICERGYYLCGQNCYQIFKRNLSFFNLSSLSD